MKRLLTCLALLNLCLCTTAQVPKKATDSLVALLASNPGLEQRVALLKKLSDQQNDMLVILKYAKEGVSLCKKTNRLKDEELFLHALSRGYFKAEDTPNGIATNIEGLELSKSLKDNEYICTFLNGLSTNYSSAGETRKAIAYGLMALEIARTAGIKHILPALYSNIGGYYINLNLLDSAEIYNKKSLQIYLDKQETIGFYSMLNLGAIEGLRGNYSKALDYYRQSVPLILKKNHFRDQNLVGVYASIGGVYLKIGPADSSFLYFNKSYTIAKQINYLGGIQKAASALADFYEGNNLKESYHYYKIAAVAKDSLKSSEKAKLLQVMLFKQHEKETEARNAVADYNNRLKLYGILLVLALVVIITVILYYSNKRQKWANKLLQEQHNELKATQAQLIQSEKMASLGELTAGIAHEIQNPLNFVNNFSEVSVELLDELKEEAEAGNKADVLAIADDLVLNLQKINHHGKRADFIVKGMLQHSRTSSGERQLTDINVLADEFLKLSYHGLRAKDKNFNAELLTNFDESLPKVNVVQQDIGRVLLNLFNNAFYAVNEKKKTAGDDYKPAVTVSTSTSTQSDYLIISVKDNGMGIPDAIKDKILQPFFTTKPTGEGTGLGLSLSYDIVVKGHGGKIEVNNEGKYTAFFIQLPLHSVS